MDSSLILPAKIAMLTVPTTVRSGKVRPIKKLTVTHRRMIGLYLRGYTYAEIAALLGRQPQTVGAVIRNPSAQNIISQAFEEHQSELKTLVPLATDVIRKGLRNNDLKAVDRLYMAIDKSATAAGETTAEDVIQRIIQIRHGDVEVTVGEQVVKP